MTRTLHLSRCVAQAHACVAHKPAAHALSLWLQQEDADRGRGRSAASPPSSSCSDDEEEVSQMNSRSWALQVPRAAERPHACA